MNHKANFKSLVIAHVIGLVVLGFARFFVAADLRFILKIILGVLIFSLIVQALMYKIKPGLFKNKVSQHPDQL